MGYIQKTLEKGYSEHLGLHAVLTVCLRFSSVLDGTRASYPPPPEIATQKCGIDTVHTPTVAHTKAWIARGTYNYRHTRE